MVRITKVYTKTGDKGSTHLAGGRKVSKISPRIEAYGGVDELNAQLGMAGESLKNIPQLQKLRERIFRIQNELFDLGSQLAVLPEDRRENTPHIKATDIERLESEIDEMNAQLPILESFVLPGGGEISSRLHVARTVCRRVEREVIRLAKEESLHGSETPYLNRLSDWLFVASRFAALKTANSETLWKPGKR
jgi:cob(I)alamin adenosyltransferase